MRDNYIFILILWLTLCISNVCGQFMAFESLKLMGAISGGCLVIFFGLFSVNYFFDLPLDQVIEVYKIENIGTSMAGVVAGLPFAAVAFTGVLFQLNFGPLVGVIGSIGMFVMGVPWFFLSIRRQPQFSSTKKFYKKNLWIILCVFIIQLLILAATWPKYLIEFE